MGMMKAAVIRTAGGPEVLKVENLPIAEPQNGQVLIHVKAFGLNRSELFTRQGHSPNVKFPRVLGIEAVGLVESAPGNHVRIGKTFQLNQIVDAHRSMEENKAGGKVVVLP